MLILYEILVISTVKTYSKSEGLNMIGNTPLICIDEEYNIWAKLETHNVTGSVKDRMVDYICDNALTEGLIDPGMTCLVEATSGNTGIALASYAASMGCDCKIIMPCNMSEQRKDMIRAMGAEIIETGPNQFKEAIEIKNKMIRPEFSKRKGEFGDIYFSFKSGFFSPMQFKNPLNVKCHFTDTAPEIHEQITYQNIGLWSAFVHGAGTGGTMMGMKNYIDDNFLGVECILTQPAESNDKHGIQGINDGADFLLDRSLVNLSIEISTEDAIRRMKRYWRESGILVGISSGANILASEIYVENFNPKGAVVTMLCDRGERYL
jgi:cysteine synthase